jgi:hypothetical protein
MKVPTTALEHAIALIKQGKRIEAQKSLKSLIAEDQHNIGAWFWLVETCTTHNQRIKILEMCLEFNQDNQQVKQSLEKFRILAAKQLPESPSKHESKRAREKPDGKYKSLFRLSVISAFVLMAINFLLTLLFSRNESTAFLYFFFVFPFTPLLSLPATAIVYFIYSSQHKGVFFLTAIGIPLIFNLVGASILIIPSLITSSLHPPAMVRLTGEYSDKLGTSYGEKSLDVSVGVTTDRSGEFMILAHLIADGQIMSVSSTDISLVPGDNSVTIQFQGEDIRRYRRDGPYLVKILSIHDMQADQSIDVTTNTWQTAAYRWHDFGGELCFILQTSIQPASSVATMQIDPAPNCPNGQGYLSGSRVTLKVTPNSGFQFKGWGGDTGGVDIYSPVITLQMQRNMVANAFLEPNP